MPTPEVNVVPSQKTAEEALKPLVIVCIVYIILDFVFLAIRFVSRFLVRRSELGWDGECLSMNERERYLPL